MATPRIHTTAVALALLAALALPVAASAQGDPPERDNRRLVLLVLPLAVSGDVQPMDQESLLAPLRTGLTPTVDLVIARAGDPRNRGLDVSGPLTRAQLLALASYYEANLVAWGGIRFSRSRDYQVQSSGPEAATASPRIAVWGLARVKLMDGVSGRMLLDQPALHVNSERSDPTGGPESVTAEERRAVERCLLQVWDDVIQIVSVRAENLQAIPSWP